MNSSEYRKLARRTMNQSLTKREQLTMLALGLGGEAGEVADLIKKVVFHGHEMDRDKLIKESGDVIWYMENLLDYFDIPMSEVYETNIQKLLSRYPDGFSEEASRGRKE
ncbi:nucleoside triphosphate pyrophosphohydrolase family protein [Thermoactinomyces daqus]|uniref:Nucleoside triphosphate pyrophosphohydrolase family protein n=1 Tax=Thermoactinomyces daqus TaxID=1329516 RepID=A0A7W2AHQ4_9BACL|nr:nucleoside triphosphate pyrophosphohydrolase family protein [Thermoactinomyces daqus]MBA4541964.1 nucleoside triphosphate pyrophosphohydrolase family protein [Thermoactinomyces daqus]